MLKIFSDRSLIPAGKPHVTMLYPFWGKNTEDPRDPFSGRFDRYAETGRDFLSLTDLNSADIAVLPLAWENAEGRAEEEQAAAVFISKAESAGKPAVVFYNSDSQRDIPHKDAVIFRTSAKRSRRTPRTFGLPAWSEDPLRGAQREAWLRKRSAKPVVGFCGAVHARPHQSLFGRLKAVALGTADSSDDDQFLRSEGLELLSQDNRITTNFIIRKSFLGGALDVPGETNYEILRASRLEYFNNMNQSDYIFCSRGQGNFSYRLYETLSCGRIPIFLDTDCLLPYHDTIDWKQYCVWVDRKELNHISERVVEFHSSVSDEGFLELQRRCRKLWEDVLSPEGFFKNFHLHFRGFVE